jgi:hypothetical protein
VKAFDGFGMRHAKEADGSASVDTCLSCVLREDWGLLRARTGSNRRVWGLWGQVGSPVGCLVWGVWGQVGMGEGQGVSGLGLVGSSWREERATTSLVLRFVTRCLSDRCRLR